MKSNYPRIPRVYVAGPLNALAVEYLHNVHSMMEHAEHLRQLGFGVYVPALDLLMGLKFGYREYGDYFNNSQPWLDASDAIFVCPGSETSKGTQKEIARADDRKIPVFYSFSVLRAYFADWRPDDAD